MKNHILYGMITIAISLLWFTATFISSYYNHNTYQNSLKRQSFQLFYKNETSLLNYQELMSGFSSFFQSSEYVDQQEMDIFYKSWVKNHELAIDADSNISYGWRSSSNKNQEYISFSHEPDDQTKKGYLASLPHSPSSHDETLPDQAGSYDVNGGKSVLFVQAVKSSHGEPGYIFLFLEKSSIEKIISHVDESTKEKFSSLVLWEKPSDDIIQAQDYVYEANLFGKKLYVIHKPKEQWRFFSGNNILAISIGFIGIMVTSLMSLFWAVQRRRDMLADKALQEAHERIQEQSDFFEHVVEHIPAVLFIKDVRNDLRYKIINKEAEKFFGLSRQDMVGKNDYDFFPEEEAKFFTTIDRATVQEKAVLDIPCETVTTKEGERLAATRKVPLYDTKGNPLYILGLAQDITKRKKNEMELSEYRENLEKMVEERTLKLKNAISKAEEASRLKSEFLATMSHEIRSPMSGVLGMAELLLDTPLTLEQKGLTRTIINSGELLMNIIEDILDFSKIEANKLELDPIAVNMLELVDDVAMLYSSKAREKALELVVHYVPGSEQFVYADPVRIRQILGNLVNNAIKFTKIGHIVIKVWEEGRKSLPADKVNLFFSVTDTGIGIDEKDFEKIFEKFSQANSSTTRDYGGTGLGLSICRKLIEMMGGKITVKSIPGQGSSFEFYLPMTRNQEEVFTQPQPPVLDGLRLLVIDDLPVIRAMLTEQLTSAGMICDSAASGHEALQKMVDARANGSLYDILLIDYLMPGMNGEMLARAINDEPDFRKACLVMLTAAGNPISGDDLGEKGFSAYIAKPVRMANLIDGLAIIWSKFSAGYTDTMIRVDTGGMGQSAFDTENFQLEGTKILLVEDSRLNQAFAEEVLAQIACDVTTVSNGQEALDEVVRKPYDLILMDCQMPVMDGFEASKRICALKKEGRLPATLPILALTANAMKGDKQRCVEAGMDDYITKPVRKRELKEKIYYWIKGQQISFSGEKEESSGHAAPEGGADDRSSHDKEIVNEKILAEARSLLKDKFDFLLNCYIDDVASYIREIQQAVASKDTEAMIRPAHTIKSTSKRMGALYLSDIAGDIEMAAREAANTNDHPWQNEKVIQNIKLIGTVFEETRKSLKT